MNNSNTSNTITEVDFDFFLTFPLDMPDLKIDEGPAFINVIFKYEYWGDKD